MPTMLGQCAVTLFVAIVRSAPRPRGSVFRRIAALFHLRKLAEDCGLFAIELTFFGETRQTCSQIALFSEALVLR